MGEPRFVLLLCCHLVDYELLIIFRQINKSLQMTSRFYKQSGKQSQLHAKNEPTEGEPRLSLLLCSPLLDYELLIILRKTNKSLPMTSRFFKQSGKQSQQRSRPVLVVRNMKKIQKQAYEGRTRIFATSILPTGRL